MPIQIEHNLYVCRVNKPTKVYKEYNDITPLNKRVVDKDIFISYQQAKLDTNTMFHISGPLDSKTYSNAIPYDAWIPVSFIEYYPMTSTEEIALPEYKSEYFLTNKQKIKLFENSWSVNPLPYTVDEGVFIETDMFVVRENNKGRKTKYRIKAINDDNDHDYCGLWMDGNAIVYTNGLKMTANDVGLVPVDKNSPSILHRKKRMDDTAEENLGDEVLEGPGYGPTTTYSGGNNRSKSSSSTYKTDGIILGRKEGVNGLNKDTIVKACQLAKADGHKLEKYKYTEEFLENPAGDYSERYWYWYYYNVACLCTAGVQFMYEIDGKTKLSSDEVTYNSILSTYCRAAVANGWSTEQELRHKYGDRIVDNAHISASTAGTKSTLVTHTYTDQNGKEQVISGAIDNEIANNNVTEMPTSEASVAATAAAMGITEDQLKAQKAEEIQNLKWNDTTLDKLYKDYGLVYTNEVALTKVPIGRLSFVHGMPFQYTYLTDRRNNLDTPFGREMYETDDPVKMTKNTGAGLDMYGRTFAREIAANTPIVVFTPGVPKFMSNIKQSILGYAGGTDNARNKFLNLFSDLNFFEVGSALQSMFNDLEDEVFQYYTLEINTTEYYSIVNSLCQFSAKLMGLDDFKMRNIPCTNFDWAAYNKNEAHDYSTMEDVFGVSRGVSFAFDPVSSIQDSITNSTGESKFSSLFNTVSDSSRELSFMLGTVDIDLDLIDQNEYTAAVANVKSGAFSGLTNPMSAIFSMLKNSAHGMRVRFPQLWQESSISKSYSLDMKFITPYATKFCKWRYVLVPFFHIFALAAPQSKDSIINYSRPFLVKAFSRGYFNIEMGIIDQLSWKRYGDGEMLSVDGIPTEIDVSVDLTDMYQQLAVSTHYGDAGIMSLDRIKVFFNNTGLQELLGNLAGIDTNRVTLSERLALYASTIKGSLGGSSAGLGRHIQDRLLTNNVARWFYGMSGSKV